VNSQVDIQAARSLTYYATFNVDLEVDAMKKDAFGNLDPEAKKTNKKYLRHIGRYCKVLTPMAKYYSSEMSMRVSNNAVAVLGGSGYMKDYASERHLRDSRITTIYEGTSQLQVVAGVAGVLSGSCRSVIEEIIAKPSRAENWSAATKPFIDEIAAALNDLDIAINFVKEQSTQYRDLMARKLVDMGIFLICGALFADQADSPVDEKMAARKLSVLKHWMAWRMPEFRMDKEAILAGKQFVNTEFEALAGPVPVMA
jgi:hypothetical protein